MLLLRGIDIRRAHQTAKYTVAGKNRRLSLESKSTAANFFLIYDASARLCGDL